LSLWFVAPLTTKKEEKEAEYEWVFGHGNMREWKRHIPVHMTDEGCN